MKTPLHARTPLFSPFLSVLVCLGVLPAAAPAQDSPAPGYEAGRGLITLEGPSGMFINPTSATLPKDAGTVQYCVFFPNNRTDVVGHGLMGGYGLTDELELGAMGNVVAYDTGEPSERGAAGPFARYRLTPQTDRLPQVSLGGYSRLGDSVLHKYGVFLAGYRRVPVSDDGTFRSVGFHAGVKQVWLDSDRPVDDSLSGYGGVELQFPLRIYAVGEIQTQDSDIDRHVPFSYGLQWRAHGIAMSIAGIQNGNTDEVSFYYGIGGNISF